MAKKAKKKKSAKVAKGVKAAKVAKVAKAVKSAAKKVAEAAKANGDRLLNFKCRSAEYETMKKHAKKYAGGNLSAWVRFACVNAKPTPGQEKLFAEGVY